MGNNSCINSSILINKRLFNHLAPLDYLKFSGKENFIKVESVNTIIRIASVIVPLSFLQDLRGLPLTIGSLLLPEQP